LPLLENDESDDVGSGAADADADDGGGYAYALGGDDKYGTGGAVVVVGGYEGC